MTPGNDWLQMAWTQTWQVTLLILAVALVVRLAAANRPQLAFVLWAVVLMKCIAPPLWSSPSGAFCWLQPPTVSAGATKGDGGGCRDGAFENGIGRRSGDSLVRLPPARRVIVVGTTSEDILECGDSLPLSVQRREPSRNVAIPTISGDKSPHSKQTAARNTGQLPTAQPARSTFAMPPLPTFLASVWLTGAIAVSCMAGWQRVRFARMLRRANCVENPVCERIMASLRRRLRLRRRVRLIVTERLVGPAVFGLLRPTVLLPQAVIDGKSAAELELILAHELVHVRRGDLWFGLLRSAAQLLWWFHPLVWWAGRRGSREAERCCDEAVLAELRCGPAGYARCLLDVLEAKNKLRCVPACPGVRAIEITQGRLERIMQVGERGYRRTPWWCWAVAVGAAAVVIPGAAIGISDDKKADSPAPSQAIEGTDKAATPEKTKAVDAAKPKRRAKDTGTKGDTAPNKPAFKAPTDEIDRMLKREPAARSIASDPLFKPEEPRRRHDLERNHRSENWSSRAALTPPPRRESTPTLAPPRDAFARALDRSSDERPARFRDVSPSRDRDLFRGPVPRDDYPIPARGVAYADNVRDYSLSDLRQVLDRIQAERGLDESASREFLKKVLKAEAQHRRTTAIVRQATIPGPLGPVENPVVPQSPNDAKNTPAPSPTPVDIVWTGNSMMVETSEEGHKRIAEALRLFQTYGTAEIRIDVRFISGRAEQLKAKPSWKFLPSDLPPSAGPNYDGGPTMPTPFDPSFDSRNGSHPIRSQFVVERVSPMMYALLDDAAGEKMLDGWKADKQVNILQAPKSTIFNGQPGFVADCSQSPFVVAVKDGQPQIRIVNSGTILRLRPTTDGQKQVKLDFRVEFSKIRSVETVALSVSRENEPATPVTIQIPEVETARVEGGVDLPWNSWLLLGGLDTKNEQTGKLDARIVMLRAEKVEPVPATRKTGPVVAPGPVADPIPDRPVPPGPRAEPFPASPIAR
jgi:beta-lactamase regulating signal transducer with metallopeptidase domain